MRPDFNKQLTERERLGHKMKFHEVRGAKNNKSFDEDTSGGKESIHRRRRGAKVNRKSFNENLNPLKNFLRENVGRPWDKIYSEITATFDKRKVINNHILEHLFQYVELEVYIVDGKACTMNKYRHRSELYSPIESRNPNYPTYYVDPRDGLMKAPKQESLARRRQRDAEESKKAEENLRKLYRRIDDDNHLICKDGIWWVYSAKLKPPKVMEYLAPRFASYAEQKAWSELPEEERTKKMIGRLVDGSMPDKIESPDVPGFHNGSWYSRGPRMIAEDKYFFKRQAASHKQLKAAGVDGMIPKEEPKPLSHRAASKYRKAA